jgi:calnexin
MRVTAFASLILSQLVVSHSTETGSFHFLERFDTDVFSSGKWVKSNEKKYVNQPVLLKPGKNAGEGFENDNGVELTQEMKHYGFGALFDTPISLTNQDFVVQYEVKVDTFNCGGAYVKLLRSTDSLKLTELNDNTPYTIMFGPDKCGGNNKVHFIVQHQNPVSQVWEEKHFLETGPAKTDTKTHLYTLIIRKDNSFQILVDDVVASEGNLLTSLTPPINPPSEIDDPTDKKPADWVDEAKIPDPDATKPDDWDEDQPAFIADPDATKPANWQDNAPANIPDPTAVKPSDWDDEEVSLLYHVIEYYFSYVL